MGLVYADIEIIRGADIVLFQEGYIEEKAIRKMKVKALVDSGSYMLAITDNIKHQLDLRKVDEQMAVLANGQILQIEIVGPVEVKFENRTTTTRAVVLPGATEVLLGSIPMEDMDVLIDPKQQKLIVNPESPYLAKKSLK